MVNLTWVFNMELVNKIKSPKKIKKILDAFDESQKEIKSKKKTKAKVLTLTQLFALRKKRKQELCDEKAKLLERIKQIDLELKGL
jgi:hypothetical protein